MTHLYQENQRILSDKLLNARRLLWALSLTNILIGVLFVALGLVWKSYSSVAVALCGICLNSFGALVLFSDNGGT